MTEFLVKYGEISLKGANRLAFEKRLMRNITRRLPRVGTRVRRTWGRIFLTVEDALAGDAARILAATFGVVSYAHVARFEKTPESFPRAADFVAAELSAGPGPGSFKVEASREDKQFGLDSYAIACLLGDLLRDRLPDFRVDVRRPDATVRVEVRDHIYVYAGQHRGPGGLPVGCSGRGLLLLSGGIDSPVAGYLMGGRGLAVDAVYFHAYPFTSAEAEQKVQRLAAALRRFLPNLALHVVPFTALQVRIKEAARAAEITLLSRCAMMSIASMLAARHGHECLITGESLAQVASQTVPSLHLTGSYATFAGAAAADRARQGNHHRGRAGDRHVPDFDPALPRLLHAVRAPPSGHQSGHGGTALLVRAAGPGGSPGTERRRDASTGAERDLTAAAGAEGQRPAGAPRQLGSGGRGGLGRLVAAGRR